MSAYGMLNKFLQNYIDHVSTSKLKKMHYLYTRILTFLYDMSCIL